MRGSRPRPLSGGVRHCRPLAAKSGRWSAKPSKVKSMVSKKVSAGIAIFNRSFELFVCHTTGRNRWDLPKGLIENNETAVMTAVRETYEETGLVFTEQQLSEIGIFQYLPQKQLHIFAVSVQKTAFRLAECNCASRFYDITTNNLKPEIDGYAWKSLRDMPTWCGNNLSRVLNEVDWTSIAGAECIEHVPQRST